MEDKVLKKKEVATRLNISLGTVDRLCKSKKLKGYKIGGSVRFKESDVNALFKTPENDNTPA
jgi:excisionase family DNA binding protein